MAKINDSFMLSMVAGLIGTSLMAASNFIKYKRKTTEVLYGHLAGSIIMSPLRLNRRKDFILGQFYHFVSGMILAFPLFYLLKFTGTDYHRLKGSAFGLFTWGTLFNVGKRFGLYVQPRLAKSHYSAIHNNFIYGLTTAEALVRLGDPGLFKPKKLEAVQSSPTIAVNKQAGNRDEIYLH